MAQSYTLPRDTQAAPVSRAGITTPFVVLAIAAASLYMAFSQISPPSAVSESAPASEFSAGRARKHIEAIAQKTHPVGSSEHQRVQDYILDELSAMGLDRQTQKAQVVAERGGEAIGASVENILARVPGTGNTSKSILLVAHYDSVPTSFGASDDGSGVATLLETARALKVASPLKNDIVLLFTDAEEVGLLGAKAFVEDKEAMKGIAVVFNFEARGNSGPSIMFETSDGNGRLINEFAKASPHPVASSLSNEIYKRLPNDTDLTVFKKAGLAGLNFAFIKGLAYYHTALDTSKNLDDRSLQHHGSYALGLARHFGNLSIDENRASNQIYFNTVGSVVIRYSETFAMILAITDILLFFAVAGYALKRRRISIPGVLLAFLAFLVSVVIVAVGATIAWKLIRSTKSQYEWMPNGSPYNAGLYLAGLVALALSISSALYALYGKRISAHNLSIGALLGWLILTLLMTLSIPGGSYLFAWPLLFGLISTALLVRSHDNESLSLKDAIAISILAIPGIVLVVPMIYLLFISLGLEATGVIVALEALLLGLFIPHMSLLAGKRRWLIPGSVVLIALGFILSAVLISGFDHEHPKANNIFYAMNADSGKAVWASFDQRPDDWTSAFLSSNVSRGSLAEYAPLSFDGFLKSEAQGIPLSPPNVTLLSDSTKNGIRTLRLQLASTRKAPLILASIEPDAGIVSAQVNGKLINTGRDQRWRIRYYGAGDEGIELALEVNSSNPVKIRAMDVSYGLPEAPGAKYGPRPENTIASPQPYSDSTLVSKSFSF